VENELAREAGAAASEVNRQMRDLVDSGLVTLERAGRVKVYRVNPQHFLFKPLKSLFRNLEEVYREVADRAVKFITEKHKVKAVILFGSLSRGRIRSDLVKEPSDLDLVIVTEGKDQIKQIEKDLINFVNSEVSARYGIVFYPILISEEEYRAGLSTDQFIIDVQARGEVLYGEKPRRFG
ncbi:MAG: nucleotidyltransferase domain-containing protein, partial [Candidatus Bathyarchaeia archaeon]